MQYSWLPRLALLFFFGSFAGGVVHAAIFPDVPDEHIYREPIESLVSAQVVKGNPDGTFSPEREVNRAEMLIMLYRAKGKTPDPSHRLCFPDVEPGSWYEAVVCDATANEYVSGYADGTFKPAQTVNRVESLKMITEVFGIGVDEISDEDREVVNFVDVSIAAWYTKYLFAAFSKGILPIAGQDGARFYPEKSLLRGEAAAYIFNALHVDLLEERQEQEEQEEEEEEEELVSDEVVHVEFPFTVNGKFNAKKPTAFLFDISEPVVASTLVSLQSGQPGGVICRLYLLGDDGFSDEYFLGYEDGSSCELLTALSPGSYQLQIQPTVADTTYTVSSVEGTGDDNDGFRDAKMLEIGELTTGILKSGDLEDWFTFSLQNEKNLTVEFSSAAQLRCIVYAMNDVDWYGFEGPECNKVNSYPQGTYYIAVGRASPKDAEQSYSLRLKE